MELTSKTNTFLQKSASVYWFGNALRWDRRATDEDTATRGRAECGGVVL